MVFIFSIINSVLEMRKCRLREVNHKVTHLVNSRISFKFHTDSCMSEAWDCVSEGIGMIRIRFLPLFLIQVGEGT